MQENKPIVLYHYPCLDGFTAAWAIWKVHPDWEFKPMKYGDTLPDLTGRDVYFVDFSVKKAVMVPVIESANRVVVLDHHKTAEEDLSILQVADPAAFKFEVHFDMNKSGAQLAWEYFHPGVKEPWIVTYVADRDLWRFRYPESKAINSFLFSFDYDFQKWEELEEAIHRSGGEVEEAGDAILRKQAKDIDEMAQNRFRVVIKGYSVPIINVPYIFASDMGNKLCKGEFFSASYYYDGARRKYIFSLRSDEDGLDVSEIAKQFGGGGHKHAAGFEIATDHGADFSRILGE